MDPYYDQDPEFIRSQCRMLYGHETWLENPRKEDGKIVIDGNYGHHMVNDRPMPIDYAHVAIFDAKGKADIKYEQGPEDNCLRVKFPDAGTGPYTVYYSSDSVPWIENDEGWSRGIKRDFRNVKYPQPTVWRARRSSRMMEKHPMCSSPTSTSPSIPLSPRQVRK